ncbi:hypothetical protein ACIRPT_38330 [Streptomyces sp. NPDC101227]|uniref:hypothetical protein n=1 Tax=Streptomyces sp. NPDC101227 TaxID=3366136 RepID=UPI0037FE332E
MATLLGNSHPADSGGALCLQVGNEENIVVFSQAHFGRRRHHFLHFQGVTAVPGGGTSSLNQINLLTGPCLFSGRAMRFIDASGGEPNLLSARRKPLSHRLTHLWADQDLSLYEYESVLRQSRVVADVTSALPPTAPLTITIDIPRVQYYLYLLDAFSHGMASPDLALEWFHLVDVRHARMAAFFRDRLLAELAGVLRGDITLRESDPLGAVGACIREAVARNTLPRLEDLLDELAATGDPVWKLLLEVQPPRDLEALGTASYVVEELRAAAVHEDSGPNLGILVENYPEWKILHQTDRLLDRIKKIGRQTSPGNLLGMYPLERLINVNPSGQPEHLYFLDPGRHALDERGNALNLFDIVDSLYE